jgi:light-regulated signal transduction histidine kinase (bacteriophytochrome)
VLLFISLGFLGIHTYNIGTSFLLFFVLAVMLAGIYYSKRDQLIILFVIIVGTLLVSWFLIKDLELTLTGGITFSGLMIGVWLLQLLSSNLLHRSLQHQKELTTKLRIEINERLNAEQKMAENNLDLEKRVRQRTAQLQAANEELQAVGYSIAHDLRAPIRAIIGLNQLVLSEHADLINQEIRDYLERTNEASSRMDSMLEGLLSLLNLGNIKPTLSQLDLSAMAEEIFSNLAQEVRTPDISFKVHPTPPTFGDPELIIELLAQLITNAINFSKQGAPVEIEFGAVGTPDQPVYFLKDNGIGIDMEYALRVFEPFTSLNQTDQYSGNGIGLTIARRIIDLHKGKIWVESEESVGSTFFFTF